MQTSSLSMMSLFFQADTSIQLIMLGLLALSIISVALIIQKTVMLKRLNYSFDQFDTAFWSGQSLDDLYEKAQYQKGDPLCSLFCAAMKEWRRQYFKQNKAGVSESIERFMVHSLIKETSFLDKGLPFLSIVGTNAMIIGLLGTVLGIMHSFQSIGLMKSANLAVVAPGVAEALFATAIGIMVALPASIGFTRLSVSVQSYKDRLETFIADFSYLIEQQSEEKAA